MQKLACFFPFLMLRFSTMFILDRFQTCVTINMAKFVVPKFETLNVVWRSPINAMLNFTTTNTMCLNYLMSLFLFVFYTVFFDVVVPCSLLSCTWHLTWIFGILHISPKFICHESTITTSHPPFSLFLQFLNHHNLLNICYVAPTFAYWMLPSF